ncbi:MAG: bifunctional 5,10-methylenetetrahydrofolate dehydrogenase/5,10-methenyltetrahydrofolate cyclohydrolase [Candidatus Uhrbacteria bacterium]|nr:bifunctional 5,10-methylenetetrahydrofolate dehydrogenase/5,10-methenyltetrahydrofolate cyclohydrolase [Candidatus Uhrbacteria bacterium]
MQLIDGKSLAARIRAEVKRDVAELKTVPVLNILLVGDDPASRLYVALKKKAASEVGVQVNIFEFAAETPDEQLISLIEQWNHDSSVHAILVQIPLPYGHDEERVIAAIDPKKDVDGFHPHTTMIPPVHEGILRLINEAPVAINGEQAAIIANSEIFAAPLQRMLTTGGMSVVMMTPDLLDAQVLAASTVVVVAVGRINFLHANMTPQARVIIDVGTNKAFDGGVCGDVDSNSYRDQDAWITPVPGGVGPMTIAQLLKNVVRLSRQNFL